MLESKIDITPASWKSQYRDYWETDVTVFEVSEPHDSLTVVASSQVEVTPTPAREERMGWDDIAGPLFQDLLAEYLGQSSATQPTEELAAFAADAAGRFSPDGAARLICELLHEQVRHVPGATTVHTPARDAWEAKSGVCQDFAHLAIGALRHVGIPARYVSGYLHPKRDASIGETVRGESHAWVEWWAGDWFGFGPTNDKEVADHHVVVARAREYRDVPPLSGVFAGAGSDLEVSVKVTLLGYSLLVRIARCRRRS